MVAGSKYLAKKMAVPRSDFFINLNETNLERCFGFLTRHIGVLRVSAV